MLARLWGELDVWTRESASAAGGPGAFLEARAPAWRQVGRVCFHLAENRGDEARPFAFLATYTVGLGAGGSLKHQPLGGPWSGTPGRTTGRRWSSS